MIEVSIIDTKTPNSYTLGGTMGLAIEVVSKLKEEMKKQGLTYSMLAKKLGLSEPALKRSFSKNIFSLERVEKIGEILGLSLQDIAKSDQTKFMVEYLSDEQERLLAENEEAFCVFYLLASGLKVSSILRHFKFSPLELQKILLKLDKKRLIKLFADNRVMTCVDQGVWWRKDGLLNSKYGEFLRTDFLKSNFEGENEKVWLIAGNVSPTSLKTFMKKQEKLVLELKELMNLDQNLSSQEKVNISFISGYRPWVFPQIYKYKK